MVESLGLRPTRTAYRSPWQNGVAERWIGSVRRELLDQVVVLNERHLRRLLNEYVGWDKRAYDDNALRDNLAGLFDFKLNISNDPFTTPPTMYKGTSRSQ